MTADQRLKLHRMVRRYRLPLLTLAAALAALALGVFALYLTRHEVEFRDRELQSLLKNETRLFAERCRQMLDEQRLAWEALAAAVPAEPTALEEMIHREPFLVAWFIADGQGRLLTPGRDSDWARRYRELFEGLVSSNSGEQQDTIPGNAQSAGKQITLRNVEPIRSFDRSGLESQSRTRAKADDKSAAAAPGSAPRLITRFATRIRQRDSGYIPWFADNRFAPLVWARSTAAPGRIVGFEVDHAVLLSRLIPLFPAELPPWFRIELVDASDRMIHAVGGALSAREAAEPVLIMPFPEQLLPNTQIRAYLVPDALPLTGSRIGLWAGVTALLLILITAGAVALYLIRRELLLAGRKSSFVSQVSHELKTPLTSIKMYAELLREHYDALSEEKRRHYLQVITDESERLTRLVGNVLDFSRLDENRKHYHPERFDLVAMLRATGSLWEELARPEGIVIRTNVPETPVMVTLDADSLRQVLYNLFDNALKYAAEGRQIDLTLVEMAGGEPVIAVRDFGPGIAVEAEEKIFRKFYRIDDALTARHGGFGLGLTIARQLLRDQGGDLTCRAVRPGCEFRIRLPQPS